MGLNDVDDTRDGIARLPAENPTAFLVAFRRNATGNAFWGRMGFSERLDITTATGRCAISSASTQRRDARTAERDPPPRREP